MNRKEQQGKPFVKILHDASSGLESYLAEIQAGLEEQSVPWNLGESSGTIVQLGTHASRESPLRVGVAIDSNLNIGLFHAQIRNGPLLYFEQASTRHARVIGENAGRLVKRTPLISIDNSR